MHFINKEYQGLKTWAAAYHPYEDRPTSPLLGRLFYMGYLHNNDVQFEVDRTFPFHSALPSVSDIYLHLTSVETTINRPIFLGGDYALNIDCLIGITTNPAAVHRDFYSVVCISEN